MDRIITGGKKETIPNSRNVMYDCQLFLVNRSNELRNFLTFLLHPEPFTQ